MTEDTPRALRLTRRFDAPPQRVFDAWLDPEIARHWLFAEPDADPDARTVEIDAHVGGRYRITSPGQGRELETIGEFLEIHRPRRIVLTASRPGVSDQVDRLTADISPDGAGAILTLTHELLPPDRHDAAETAWEGMFDLLDTALA